MDKVIILIMCVLAFWGCMIGLGVLYGLIAPALALIGMCATAGMILLIESDDK